VISFQNLTHCTVVASITDGQQVEAGGEPQPQCWLLVGPGFRIDRQSAPN